jgi:hypothetical protein
MRIILSLRLDENRPQPASRLTLPVVPVKRTRAETTKTRAKK